MTQVMIAIAGDRALLVELDSITAHELHAAAANMRNLPDVVSCVVGHSSLYVIYREKPDADTVMDAVRNPSRQPKVENRRHSYTVSFADAPDLPAFLARVGMTLDEFMRRIRDVRLVARYIGFRGGFAYLDGWPEEWAMPRRPTSRPVKRGSFAIAATVAAFYPLDTPGGWNILGVTNGDLRIEPGDEITIEPTMERIAIPSAPLQERMTIPGVEIEGPLAIVTDRPFDIEAAQLANAGVGNSPDAPLIECAMVVPRIKTDRQIAWVGPNGIPGELPPGKIEGGLRGYVAIGAGVAASASGAGGREQPPLHRRLTSTTIIAIAGPHDIGLRDVECEVTPQLDRVGIRLRPVKPIAISAPADMKSIGMQCGTVQLHPDGSLMAMGPDHPVTGGYLQPMTVITPERWKLAQLSPGVRVRFVIQEP